MYEEHTNYYSCRLVRVFIQFSLIPYLIENVCITQKLLFVRIFIRFSLIHLQQNTAACVVEP